MDTAVGGNFGAFTTNRPAAAMKAAGCETTIIGHCEERNDKSGILAEAGVTDTDAVNRLLNQEIKCAIDRGLSVLYCIGEKSEEQDHWQEVLGKQLEIGLKDVDTSRVVIAYEPICCHWSRQNSSRQRIYHQDRPLCKRKNWRHGHCVWRRPETGKCGNAGIHPRN